jgi:hypothetical protein
MLQTTTLTASSSSPDALQLADSLGIDDASVVLALIAEVEAIFCAPAEHLVDQPPAPPATGCALREPRCAGRSFQQEPPLHPDALTRRVDPMQRSPPGRRTSVPSMT